MKNNSSICVVFGAMILLLSACSNDSIDKQMVDTSDSPSDAERTIEENQYINNSSTAIQEDSSEIALADGEVAINSDSFPDEIFREYVESNFDINKDYIFQKNELEEVTEISIYGSNDENLAKITSLSGIEYFENLEILNCADCCLEDIDVSANANLKKLNLFNNNLVNIDLSQNKALEDLTLGANSIEELDLSQNYQLKILYMLDSPIKNIDISNNIYLEELYLRNMLLISIDLSKNTELIYLDISTNPVTELDLTANTKLLYLECENTAISELDLTNNAELDTLVCRATNISSIDLSANPKISTVVCGTATEVIGCDESIISKVD